MKSVASSYAALLILLGCAAQPDKAVPTSAPATAPAAPLSPVPDGFRLTKVLDGRAALALPADAEVEQGQDSDQIRIPCGDTELVVTTRDLERSLGAGELRDTKVTARLFGLRHEQVSAVVERRGTEQLVHTVPVLAEAEILEMRTGRQFIRGASLVVADGSFVTASFAAGFPLGAESQRCGRLAETIAESLRAGSRRLDLAGGLRELRTGYRVKVPEGWYLEGDVSGQGIHYRIIRLTSYSAYVAPEVGFTFLHLADHPAFPRAASSPHPIDFTTVGDPTTWSRDIEDPFGSMHAGVRDDRYAIAFHAQSDEPHDPDSYQVQKTILRSLERVPGAKTLDIVTIAREARAREARTRPRVEPNEDEPCSDWRACLSEAKAKRRHDPNTALELIERACRFDIDACYRGAAYYGATLEFRGAIARPAPVLASACERGHSPSCGAAEIMARTIDETADDECKDVTCLARVLNEFHQRRHDDLLDAYCAGGRAIACERRGYDREALGDTDGARTDFDRACQLGLRTGCYGRERLEGGAVR